MTLEDSIHDMRSVLVDLLNTSDYSDLVIESADQEYSVHKCIVFGQCPKLRDLADTDESNTCRLDLKEENPKVVHYLVDYLYKQTYYTHDYDDTPKIRVNNWNCSAADFKGKPWNDNMKKTLSCWLYLCSARNDEDNTDLVSFLHSENPAIMITTAGNCILDLSNPDHMNSLCELASYSHQCGVDYQDCEDFWYDGDGAVSEGNFIDHIGVYTFAKRHEINGLKVTAAERFTLALTHMDVNPEFAKIARHVYTSDDIDDAELWKKVVSERLFWCMEDIGMFPEIKEILEEVPGLAADILHYHYVEAPPRPDLAE